MNPRTPITKVLPIGLAHLLNDYYMNFIQTLLPFMVAAGLAVSKGAFLVSAFTFTSSLIQPLAGFLVDQKNQRWLVYAGTLWMAVLLSMVGLIGSYPLLIVIVTLAGLGTAAFHPQASAMVSSVSGDRKGLFQAVFITSGNLGYALTPLVVVPLTEKYGMGITPVFAIPGIMVAVLLLFTAPRVGRREATALPPLLQVFRPVWAEVTRIALVVALRSLTFFGMISFLPLYLRHHNISLVSSSRLVFLMLFAGALGGLAGGYLSDRFGRKAVIVGSLVLASPLFHAFLLTEGPLGWFLLAMAGAALLASFSVTVVLAQEVISRHAAMAAGLMLGFGVGVGGLGVGVMGLVAEYVGIDFTIYVLVWIPIAAGLLGLSLGRGKAAQS